MKKKISIIPFEENETCNIFSITIDDGDCEMIKFSNKVTDDGKREDLQIISGQLQHIGERGAEERYFRPAGKRKDNVWELPGHYLVKSKYRLYCLRYGTTVIILGNGGLKSTRTYQEDPVLNECVETLQKIDAAIQDGLRSGSIIIDKKGITGKIEFYI